MEAMWTRFLPVTQAIKRACEDPALGDLKVLSANSPEHVVRDAEVELRHADLSGDFDIHSQLLILHALDLQALC